MDSDDEIMEIPQCKSWIELLMMQMMNTIYKILRSKLSTNDDDNSTQNIK